MSTISNNDELDIKIKLLVLWIFVFLNMIFRDLHELGRPGMLEEMMTGVVNGVEITEVLMLVGGIMIEIPLLMLPLTLFLPYRSNRLTNILIAILMIPLNFSVYYPFDLDDMFFLFFEITALLLIILFALRWFDAPQKSDKSAPIAKKDS